MAVQSGKILFGKNVEINYFRKFTILNIEIREPMKTIYNVDRNLKPCNFTLCFTEGEGQIYATRLVRLY